ncbi:MAG: glycosyltransferase family 2 protein [Bacteroidales bacterium]|nr:glycosyltransferase family 2 protein [Bacteroidales bacterium]
MCKLHVIMPVKDSMETARDAIRAVMSLHDVDFTVYNDFSSEETTAELSAMSSEYGFRLVNWADSTSHPSPNYRLTLQDAQRRAVQEKAHLVIVESDVTVKTDTIERLSSAVVDGVGLVAAVTVDSNGEINFPYLYARKLTGGTVPTSKRLSICCTLVSNEFLGRYSFDALDPDKQWYDVFISHQSLRLGFRNLLMLDNRVLHRPHSSRPWKLLKYTNPLKYYWLKIVNKRDRI